MSRASYYKDKGTAPRPGSVPLEIRGSNKFEVSHAEVGSCGERGSQCVKIPGVVGGR